VYRTSSRTRGLTRFPCVVIRYSTAGRVQNPPLEQPSVDQFLDVARLNRRARREGEQLQAFACSTAPQLALLKRVPQFEQPLRRVKLGFLVGGWLLGRLFRQLRRDLLGA
jgi:hypothetical protein